jgi:hypothetical protein
MKEYQVVKLRVKRRNLWLFGCEHSSDSTDLRFKALGSTIDQFIKRNNRGVLAAERSIPDERRYLRYMVKKYQEMGYLAVASIQRGIPLHSVETTLDKVIKRTIKDSKYSRSDIIVWKMLNRLWWLYQSASVHKMKCTFLQISEKDRVQLKKLTGTRDSLKSVDVLKYLDSQVRLNLGKSILLNKIGATLFDRVDHSFIKKIVNPFNKETMYNSIGAELNFAREKLLAENIFRQLRKSDVLVVVGLNHLKPIVRQIRSGA